MKTIFKYRTFETSEEFEEWQESNDPETLKIYQMSPIILKADISGEEYRRDETMSHGHGDLGIETGIFVVYSTKATKG